MAVARNIEDSERMMRTAALERLRKEHGVVVSRYKRNPQGIADEITKIEGRISSSDPMVIIRAWLGLKPEQAAQPARFMGSGKEYKHDRSMQAALERLGNYTRPISMTSKVGYNRLDMD